MAGEKLETVEVVEQKPEGPQIKSFGDFWIFFKNELKPKGNPSTAFNLLSIISIVFGIILIVYRFAAGLGHPVTNLNQSFPWGLWIGFYVMCGVAFAAGGYVLAFIVYILGVNKYRPLFRVTILNAFLSYVFCAVVIAIGLGRWWNIPNVFLGIEFGVSSVMFVVAWLFLLYILTSALEFSPAVAEWLGKVRFRKIVGSLAFGAVVFGVTISIIHQTGLGALMTMAKGKIHPLWYTEFLPVMFFISSIYAGVSMVLFEGTISHKVFTYQIDEDHHHSHDDIIMGLARICAGVIFSYLFLNIILVQHEGDFALINTSMGYWWLLEIVGFAAIPGLMFIHGAQKRNTVTIRAAAIIAMVGILLNRYNNVFLAYNWNFPLAEKYYPSFIEILATLAIIFLQIWVFRWVVNRMSVMRKSPQWASTLDKD